MRTVTPKNAHFVPDDAKRVFEGVIYDVYQWQQPMYDGTTKTFEMLKRPDTIKVICVKGDKIVAIVDQQPTNKPKFTLPGGRHDVQSEIELDCAKREVKEETGMTFKHWKLLDAEQFHSKIEQVVYIFLAYDLDQQTDPQLDGGEKIEMREISFAEAKAFEDRAIEKYWPVEIFAQVNSLQELLDLPEYS